MLLKCHDETWLLLWPFWPAVHTWLDNNTAESNDYGVKLMETNGPVRPIQVPIYI